jgi:hypothetical protein
MLLNFSEFIYRQIYWLALNLAEKLKFQGMEIISSQEACPPNWQPVRHRLGRSLHTCREHTKILAAGLGENGRFQVHLGDRGN